MALHVRSDKLEVRLKKEKSTKNIKHPPKKTVQTLNFYTIKIQVNQLLWKSGFLEVWGLLNRCTNS